jgi:hypothetical protein
MVQKYADERYPRNLGVELRILLPDGRRAREPLPMVALSRQLCNANPATFGVAEGESEPRITPGPRDDQADLIADLRPSVREVYQLLLDGGPGVHITIEEAAQRLGRTPNKHFQEKFSELVSLELVKSSPRDGYFIPKK